MQHLKDMDISSRLSFAEWMLRNIDLTEVIWFSEEAHFTLNGHVNKQNMRFLEIQNQTYAERPLHSQKVTVWAALSSAGIIGPFFYEENGETTAITSQRYLTILKTKFLPELRRRDIEMNKLIPHFKEKYFLKSA